jgi:hypothetical protein
VRVIREPGKSGNVLATIAIGEDYLKPFMEYALHTWQMYAERHDLGIIVFDEDLIPRDHPKWKKANWQKFLIGWRVGATLPSVQRICHLDTDILVNPVAPDVFQATPRGSFGLISKRTGLPYPREAVLRRIAFLRNRYFDDRYPLDSNLFMSLDQMYGFADLPTQADDACSGVFVFDMDAHAAALEAFFMRYDQRVITPTGGGEQVHFNHYAQTEHHPSWLPYEFQALWTHEVAWKYPFLYTLDRKDDELVRRCIEASLSTNFFLHFAGSWYESDMWSQVKVLTDPELLDRWERFAQYLRQPVTGKFVGPVKPTT